ncbi:MAG: hypothetical protein HFJ42_07655 [Clostridia bacterium]|nr:hypothetical protein [Clostridia bacterium]
MMVNLKPQVYEKLQEISNIEVSYFHPKELVEGKKLISYYELDNSEASRADDEEYSSNIAIQVDVWCDTPEECSELAIKVNNKMKDIGFHRTKCLDLYEEGAIKHQKTMCFEKEEIL